MHTIDELSINKAVLKYQLNRDFEDIKKTNWISRYEKYNIGDK